jgi:iron complex transport system substrate-binding protein
MTADDVFRLPMFATTPAAARRAFISMDGLYLLGFGPRTAEAARDLSFAIYPDIGGSATRRKMSAHTVECH